MSRMALARRLMTRWIARGRSVAGERGAVAAEEIEERRLFFVST